MTMNETSVSRRSFIGGAGAAGIALALGGLGGCAPAAPTESSKGEAAGTAEGGKQSTRWSFDVPPEPVAESDIKETVEADVVVVGAGLAGTLAALAAAEEGASVIVLQKGSAAMSHGIGFSVFDSQLQRDDGAEFDLRAWTDFFAKDCYGYGNQAYIESIIYNSGKALDMVMDLIKDKPSDFGTVVPYANKGGSICMWDDPEVDRGYSRVPQMIAKLTIVAQELGVEYRFKTPGEQLEMDGDRVGAVIAKGPDGYVRARASKGVILATGDIGNDPEMVARYAPFCQGLPNTYMPPDNTGDGHKMALWVGAQMFNGPFSQAIHYDPSPLPEGDAPFSGSPYLAVNARGERYQNEDLAYPIIANSNVQQPDKLRWQIVDGSLTKYWDDFGDGMCRNHGFYYTTNEEGLEGALKSGAIMQADTLEGLADNMGFEGEARERLLKTIERYNELVDLGEDLDFGKNPEYLKKTGIKEPPFYSIKRTPGPLGLLDGVYCNNKMQALDENLGVIEGLYAAGNVGHGMFGCDYTISVGGISCGRAFSSGYVAGKAAVDKLPDYKSYYQAPTGQGTIIEPVDRWASSQR